MNPAMLTTASTAMERLRYPGHSSTLYLDNLEVLGSSSPVRVPLCSSQNRLQA
jgi:hypothetical protein